MANGKVSSKSQQLARAGCQSSAELNAEAAYSARALRDARVILCCRRY
jgi:hypothetical protein